MEQIILVVHLLIALAIIGLIMMQRGKGADIGASFGAGGSQTLFGSTGNVNILTKGTAWLVAAFFATSFGLAMIADSKTADTQDLGFELPIDVMETTEITEPMTSDDVPATDMPEVSMEAVGADQSSDVPVVDVSGTEASAEVIESDGDVPQE